MLGFSSIAQTPVAATPLVYFGYGNAFFMFF